MINNRSLATVVAVAVAAILQGVPLSQARAAVSQFDLPSQPLGAALRALGSQTSTDVLFDPPLVEGRDAPALKAGLTPDEAFSRLLAGTGLSHRFLDDKTVIVMATANEPANTGLHVARAEVMHFAQNDQSSSRDTGTSSSAGTSPRTAGSGAAAGAGDSKAEAGGALELEEVVVTAQLRSQTLQSVPAAVTALSPDALAKVGATDLELVAQLVPSLQITPLREGTQIFLRGVGQILTGVNADPAVAVNVNGVYVPAEMSGSALFDVDRIEVVPGPQGTLYGRNATGGVINVLTRRPGKEFESDGYVEFGNYGRIQDFTAVNVPITSDLAVRSAFSYIRQTGYFSNGLDDQDTLSGRITGVWTPSETTEVTGIAAYTHDGGYGAVAQNIPPPAQGWRYLAFDPRALGYNNDVATRYVNLTATHDVNDHVKLTYIGGYNRIDLDQNQAAYPGPPVAGLVTDLMTHAVSQELRMNAAWDRLQAVFGLYYFDIKSNSVGAVAPIPGYVATSGFVQKNWGEAAFGQLTYSLLDNLRLTGGLRYTQSHRNMAGDNVIFFNGVTSPAAPFDGERTDDHLDWRGGLEYDLTSNSMIYGSVATGFTSGGFSTSPEVIGQPQAAPFLPVTLTAYTTGIKNRFLNNQLTVNLEGFYYDYKNYQVSARNPQTAQNIVYNAQKAEVYGAQLDTSYRFTATDTLTLSGTHLDAKAIRLITPLGNFDGYSLPYSPEWNTTFSYSHTFGLGNGSDIVALVDSSYSSTRWGNYAHAAGTELPAQTTSNANLTFNSPSGKWSVGAWVRNIENRVTPLSGLVGAVPGPAAYFLAPPRTYGGSFSYNFGGGGSR